MHNFVLEVRVTQKLFCTKCRREAKKPDARKHYVCPHCLTDHVKITSVNGRDILMRVYPVHTVETSYLSIT
jgi:Zn finger protein HypA/HybF involved in hydrogenase expression